MKQSGKDAWLITWEGSEAPFNGKCKIVAILPLRSFPLEFGGRSIKRLLRALFYSHYDFTLREKIMPSTYIQRDHLCGSMYTAANPEYYYGFFGKQHLSARLVKHLWCEENKRSNLKETLHWTELAKFRWEVGWDGDGDPSQHIEQVLSEKETSYTYDIRPAVDAFKRREERAKRQAGGGRR